MWTASKNGTTLIQRVEKYARTRNLMFEHFQCQAKALSWMRTPNPNLNNQCPEEVIRQGKFECLHKALQSIGVSKK